MDGLIERLVPSDVHIAQVRFITREKVSIGIVLVVSAFVYLHTAAVLAHEHSSESVVQSTSTFDDPIDLNDDPREQ
jgi:hypothetical protein